MEEGENKVRREAEKSVMDIILKSAMGKGFYKSILNDVLEIVSGDARNAEDVLGGVLGSAIWHVAYEEPFEDWKNQAEGAVLVLGLLCDKKEQLLRLIDIEKFYRSVKSECVKEVQAFFAADSAFKLGADVESMVEEVKKILSE